MREFICKKCNFRDYPSCMVSKIITNEDFDDFIKNNNNIFKEYPVCHKNAQILENGIMNRTLDCDNCGLCMLTCIYNNSFEFQITYELEKVIFANLDLLNVFLSAIINKDTQVGTEIHFEGNSRNKRIDVVIKKDKLIFLVKVINSTEKKDFYSRSYDEIIKQCAGRYKDYQFRKILLFKRSIIRETNIDNLLELLRDGGN